MKIHGIEDDGIYKARVCKRCGNVFLAKFAGTEFLDGGFTHHNHWEDSVGWAVHADIGWLCPECEKEYQSQIKAFMSKKDDVCIDECKTI